MGTASSNDELIDVVVRLPRKTIEDMLLSAPAASREADQVRLETAKVLLSGRRRRTTCFGGVHFYDPSWDMMLELYVATGEHRLLAVSQLCGLSGGSTTTALRHIEHLEALGYIGRKADPNDRRRIIVMMLPPLAEAFDRWLDLQMAAGNIAL